VHGGFDAAKEIRGPGETRQKRDFTLKKRKKYPPEKPQKEPEKDGAKTEKKKSYFAGR